MARPLPSRRVFLRSAAGLSLPLLGACTTSRVEKDGFSFEDGIGRRPAGPSLSLLSNGLGQFPRATQKDWWRPECSVDSFSRLDAIFTASTARRANTPRPWQRAAQEPAITFDNPAQVGAATYGIDDYLDRNVATGLLIARGDTILVERYQYARTDAMRLTSFSMAKTIVALLVGLAVEDGLIGSIDDLAEKYATSLAGTEYGRTPIKALLTMSSGVKFREDYIGIDDAARLSRATFGQASPGGADAVRAFNERIAPAGKRWSYASAETFVLAMVLRAVFGKPLVAVLQERIWQPMGAEADATWLVDRSGLEVGFMGFNAVLRDYARLGMLLADRGQAGGRQLVPAAWIAAMTMESFAASSTGRPFGYGYQTWILPSRRPTFALFGVRGQFIFVEQARRLVMVHTAVRADPRDPGNAATFALWRGVRASLPPDPPSAAARTRPPIRP